MRALRLLVVLCVAVLFPTLAVCDDHVSGTCTAGGKTTALRHGYAFWKARNDPSKSDVHLLLTDEPIPTAAVPNGDDAVQKMAELVREEKVHGIELHFDGAGNTLYEPEQGAIYNNAVSPGRQGVHSPGLHYEANVARDGKIAGRLWLDKDSAELLEWNCKATFEVAAPPKRS